MKKSEIFEKVLLVVSEQTEVSEERILSTERTNEVADARCIAIFFWKKYGLDTAYLMQQMNRQHHNSVQHLYNQYADRQQSNRYFRYQSTSVGQQLAKTLPISGQ